MPRKLTLRMDKKLIEEAKQYARKHGKSVSQIVEDYFSLLNKRVNTKKTPSLPLTNSLRGVLKDCDLSEEDYKQYLLRLCDTK